MKGDAMEGQDARVGKAFSCPDGLVRWVTRQSKRGYLHVLWREADGDTWYDGGIYKSDKLVTGDEVAAPTESYKLAGASGLIREVNL